MKTFEQFINKNETMKKLFDSPPWEPLYNFLKQIFGDDYKEAANQWMFMEIQVLGSTFLSSLIYGSMLDMAV